MKGTHLHCRGMQTGPVTLESCVERTLKLPKWSYHTIQQFFSQELETKTLFQKKPAPTALFTIAELWKQTKSSKTDEWDKKMAYLYNEKLLISTKR